MRIGITCYPTYGGSGAIATELGLALARRGHEVHFISYASPFRLRGFAERVYFHEVDTTISRYPLFDHFPYTLALAAKQYEVSLREELEILHVHYAIPHATTAWLAREMLGAQHAVKVVTTLHGTDITLVGQESSFYQITKFSIEKSDEVTAVSAFLRDETYRTFGCVNCNVRVIPNFVNLEEYRPDPTVSREKMGPGKIITHISNFREVKRVCDCIRVLAEARRTVDCELWMAGDGPDRSAAERLAFELGVHPHLHFLGKQNHVELLIPQCDVLLLPSRMESFGLAALEAMACGVVPVATRVGGVPELVTDGVDGFLEAVGDTTAQAARVVQILTDDALRTRLKWAARDTAESRFCTTRIIPRYEAYYQEVLARA